MVWDGHKTFQFSSSMDASTDGCKRLRDEEREGEKEMEERSHEESAAHQVKKNEKNETTKSEEEERMILVAQGIRARRIKRALPILKKKLSDLRKEITSIKTQFGRLGVAGNIVMQNTSESFIRIMNSIHRDIQLFNEQRLKHLRRYYYQTTDRITNKTMTELVEKNSLFSVPSFDHLSYYFTPPLDIKESGAILIMSSVVSQKQVYFGGIRNRKFYGPKGCFFASYGLLRTNWGITYIGNFNGLENGNGKQYDLRTGKLIYEGQMMNGKRHGYGEEFDLKSSKCRRGVWNAGMLKEPEKVYEFSIINYSEISHQLVPKNEIGCGGNAKIYSVNWKSNKKAAAKIISLPPGTSLMGRMVVTNTIRRSLSLLASMDHPNIIKIYGMIQSPGKIGYLMSKCVSDIDTVISEQKDKLDLKEKLRILLATAKGMKFLHSKGVMNRDLKWSNVLMTETRGIVLTDLDTAKRDHTLWRNSVQNTSDSIGTPVFLALDVFSYGVMIYSIIFELMNPYAETLECPGCHTPITEINMFSFPNHVRNHNLRPALDYNKLQILGNENQWLVTLMKLCWQSNPKKRPSFAEIVHLLDRKMNRLKDTIITLVVRTNPPIEEKIMLVDYTFKSLEEKISKIWPSSKIEKLFLVKGGSNMLNQVDLPRENDEEFGRLIMEEESPVILLELDRVQIDEDSEMMRYSKKELFDMWKRATQELELLKKQNDKQT